jgi:hypothetical protein
MSELTAAKVEVISEAMAQALAVQPKHVAVMETERAGARSVVEDRDKDVWQWLSGTDTTGVMLRLAIDLPLEERSTAIEELRDRRVKRLLAWR